MGVESEYADYLRRTVPTQEVRQQQFEAVVRSFLEKFPGTEFSAAAPVKGPSDWLYDPILSFSIGEHRFYIAMPEGQDRCSLLYQGEQGRPEWIMLFLKTTSSKEEILKEIHRAISTWGRRE